MIIKKYTAKTEDDAVNAAKKDLGNGIVIMNVKTVKPSGLFRIFKSNQVEVTVALEEEKEKVAAVKKEKTAPQPKEEPKTTVRINNDVKHPVDEIGQKLDSLQSLLEKQIQTKTEEEKPREEEKEESVVQPKEEDKNARFMKLLHNTMVENEVSEEYANQIMDGLEKNLNSNTTIEHLLSSIYQKTILKFGQPQGITKAQNNPKVVYFIGPTGVGKTTTIAKIASRFCVEEKAKVALLTTDTYRIAAAEQLRTYANILEVPLQVIYTVDELKKAVEDFRSYDYILVDTTGHSHKNEEQKSAMLEFVNGLEEDVEREIYLVLSATTKYNDMITIADTYSKVLDFRLIFTKLDETSCYGNLLNIRLRTGAQMSYVTCGQNVPYDIELFNPQQTVRILLSGRNE